MLIQKFIELKVGYFHAHTEKGDNGVNYQENIAFIIIVQELAKRRELWKCGRL